MSSHRPIESRAGILAGFASLYLIWGTTYLAIALTIQTIPPFIAGSIRYVVAAVLMYGWLRLRDAQPLKGVPILAALACGVLLSGIGNGFVIWAQQGVPSGIAALLVAATPVAVGVLDWTFFSRKRPSAQAMLGIVLGFAGVITIVLHTRNLSGAVQPMHLFAMFAAVAGWSIGTLQQKRLARAETVLSFTCVQMFSGGVFQLLMAFVNDEWHTFDPHAISLTSVVALVYLMVFGSLVALNAYLWLLTRVSAQKVTTYALVNPVVAVILGAVILDERITSVAIVAAVLVLVGVALVLFQNMHFSALNERRRGAAVPGAVITRSEGDRHECSSC